MNPIIPYDARYTTADFAAALRRAYANMNALAELARTVDDHVAGRTVMNPDAFEHTLDVLQDVEDDTDMRLNLMDAWLLCCDRPRVYGPLVAHCREAFGRCEEMVERVRDANNAMILFELEANGTSPALLDELREEADGLFLLPREVAEWLAGA